MSDVAAVAAITGGVSVLTSGVTAAVTWAVSKNSTSVELAKVSAENERLQQSNREEERRNRQSAYHQFLDVLTRVFQSFGTETTYADLPKTFDEYNHLLSGVLLFGPPSVREGATKVNRVYEKIWTTLEDQEKEHPEKTVKECWRDATSGLAKDFSKASRELTSLMHADVTRGIADDPSRTKT